MVEVVDGAAPSGRNTWPEDTKSEGGNVTANDGSTAFVQTGDMRRFNPFVAAPDTPITGHWNDVKSYDKVNP